MLPSRLASEETAGCGRDMSSIKLTCAACGVALPTAAQLQRRACPACGTELLVKNEGGARWTELPRAERRRIVESMPEGELSRLDREWLDECQGMVRTREGGRIVYPSTAQAVLGAILGCGSGGLLFLLGALSGIIPMALTGLIIFVICGLSSRTSHRNARLLEPKRAVYEARRREILDRLREAASAENDSRT